jgi:hypothetical protein
MKAQSVRSFPFKLVTISLKFGFIFIGTSIGCESVWHETASSDIIFLSPSHTLQHPTRTQRRTHTITSQHSKTYIHSISLSFTHNFIQHALTIRSHILHTHSLTHTITSHKHSEILSPSLSLSFFLSPFHY